MDSTDEEHHPMRLILKDVFGVHVSALKSVEDNWKSKLKKLKERYDQMLKKGQDLQTKYDDMTLNHDLTQKELQDVKIRLAMPCKSCEVLRGQLEQQEKLYHLVLHQINPTISRESESRSKPTRSEPDIDSLRQSHTFLLSKPTGQSKSKISSQSDKTLPDDDQSEAAEEISPGGGKGRSLKLPRNSKRTRTKYTEGVTPETKKQRQSPPEKPANHSDTKFRKCLLQPIETQYPDFHDNTIDILAPQTMDMSQGGDTYHKHVNFDLSDEGKLSGAASKRRERAYQKPNIIVPETVPFDMYDIGEDSSNDDIQMAVTDKDRSADQTGSERTVVHVDMSPPTHASTPLVTTTYRHISNITKQHDTISDPLTNRIPHNSTFCDNQSDVSKSCERTTRRDSTLSEPTSPVFGAKDSVHQQTILTKSTQSPSLFDEEEDQEVIDNSPVRKIDFKEEKRVLNTTGDGSPSVLSGRFTSNYSKYSPAKGRNNTGQSEKGGWNGKKVVLPHKTAPSPKKMIQTTLNLSKLAKKCEFNPEKSHRNEEEILRLAMEESRQHYEKESEARVGAMSQLSFTGPQFTSTQAPTDKEHSPKFKIPFPPKGKENKCSSLDDVDMTRDMGSCVPSELNSMMTLGVELNGSLDPETHLSQYVNPQIELLDQSECIISGNKSEATQTLRRSGRIRNSQNSQEGADASITSVVFNGKGQRSDDNQAESRSKLNQNTHAEMSLEFETCPERRLDLIECPDDSFDRVPVRNDEPGYAYVDVVRKHHDRKKLQSFTCIQCEQYFGGMDLTEEERVERMKLCRHKARFLKPGTPEHYWSMKFPDTQEAQERGYVKTTQVQPSKFRRRRAFKSRFSDDKDENDDIYD